MQMKLLKIQYVYFHNFYWCRSMKINWTALYACKSSHDLFLFLNARRKRRVRNKLGVKEQLLEVEAEAEVPLRRGGEKQILLPSKV